MGYTFPMPDPEAPRRAEKQLSKEEVFNQELTELPPTLRAFAKSLCHNPSLAQDLVQDTMVKALSNRDKYEEGTNMRAWTFTILRNHYYSGLRKSKREIEDVDGKMAAMVSVQGSQESASDLRELREAFAKLTPDHQEILMMTRVDGRSYAETAELLGIVVGTVKSRVNRAQARLIEIMGNT